jgi:RES domain-containing protein
LFPLEGLKSVLHNAPLVSYSGFSYRVIEDRWRSDPLSAIGAFENGGRYNAPGTFSVLYTANSRVTAFKEVQALFDTANGQLADVPRNPELVLTLEVTLLCLLDLTDPELCTSLGTSREELTSVTPSRFILNAHGKTTPTQDLGAACYLSERISALKVPSAAHSDGFCLDILPDRLFIGEHIAIRDEHHRLRDELLGQRTLQ